MDAKDAPAGAVDLAENGAGAADQPAVCALLHPVSVRLLVAGVGGRYFPRVGRLLSRTYFCRAGAAHAGVQRFARLRLLPPVSADAPPAAATTLCRALAVADL